MRVCVCVSRRCDTRIQICREKRQSQRAGKRRGELRMKRKAEDERRGLERALFKDETEERKNK